MKNKIFICLIPAIISLILILVLCKFNKKPSIGVIIAVQKWWTIPITLMIVFGFSSIAKCWLNKKYTPINKWDIILQDIICPIFEEAIFTILPFIFIEKEQYIYFIFMKSFIFSAAHLSNTNNLKEHIYLFLLSVITGLSLFLTNNIFVPLVLHIFNNSLISWKENLWKIKLTSKNS